MTDMMNQRGISAISIILILLILAALAFGGVYIYRQKLTQEQNLPQVTSFEYVDLNEDVVVFLFRSVPLLYNRIARLNNELTLIDAELERIKTLENEYPSQKRIVESERVLWLKIRKDLTLSVQSAQSAAKSYYVSYSVNSEKGRELIRENVGPLIDDIDKVLKESNEETRRLKTSSKQTFMERLKGIFQK